MTRTAPPPASPAVTTAAPDLRTQPHADVLDRVEAALRVRLDRETCVRKRRSVGAVTDRGTWVRIEVRTVAKAALAGQGFGGVEAAAVLEGIAKPAWHAAVSWADPERGLLWRADETERVTAPPIKPGGVLTTDPGLSDRWWTSLNISLDALAAASTTRVATLHTTPMTQVRLTEAITSVFGDIDTRVEEWVPAHADLTWANLTGPDCWLLDWEDWGLAPRGLDAAMLWSASLAVPGLAERVQRERRVDLDSRSGRLAQLFFCAELLADVDYAGVLAEPARRAADWLLAAWG
jgi:hypothetical protein